MSIKNKTTAAQSTNYHFTFVANIFSHGLSTSPLLLMCSSWNKMRRELCLSYSSLGWYHDSTAQALMSIHYYIIELFVMKYDPQITASHSWWRSLVLSSDTAPCSYLEIPPDTDFGWSILTREMQLKDHKALFHDFP